VTDIARSTQFLVCTINWELLLLVLGCPGHYIGDFFSTAQQGIIQNHTKYKNPKKWLLLRQDRVDIGPWLLQ